MLARTAVLLLFAMVLASCAEMRWQKAGADEAAIGRDLSACRQQARMKAARAGNLGLPPVWYKSMPYRSRAVIDPRGVLKEFDVTLPEGTSVQVWDSTAEVRYIVIPLRPKGTENLTEEQLAELVTRNSMIGTGLVGLPS